uniref:Fibronectin type-III domain-containing protein n=1 Tax=Nitrosopumivirus cobalaminus TaxID=3158414 RepID=A0AAU7N4A3_9VIRU
MAQSRADAVTATPSHDSVTYNNIVTGVTVSGATSGLTEETSYTYTVTAVVHSQTETSTVTFTTTTSPSTLDGRALTQVTADAAAINFADDISVLGFAQQNTITLSNIPSTVTQVEIQDNSNSAVWYTMTVSNGSSTADYINELTEFKFRITGDRSQSVVISHTTSQSDIAIATANVAAVTATPAYDGVSFNNVIAGVTVTGATSRT